MNWTPESLAALDKRIINGHPAVEIELDPGPPEPHWRPWGLKWKTAKPERQIVYLCANCERLGNVLFLTEDRWICTSCKNEGNARPTFVPVINRKG